MCHVPVMLVPLDTELGLDSAPLPSTSNLRHQLVVGWAYEGRSDGMWGEVMGEVVRELGALVLGDSGGVLVARRACSTAISASATAFVFAASRTRTKSEKQGPMTLDATLARAPLCFLMSIQHMPLPTFRAGGK